MTDLFGVALQVLSDVKDAITNGPTKTPSRVAVVAGQIAWDSCEGCGLLQITLVRMFLSDTFPLQAAQTPQGQCTSPYLCADMTMQLIRCAPVPDAQGNGPSTAQLQDSGFEIMTDAQIMLPTAACSLKDQVELGSLDEYVITALTPQGPAGACVGNQLDFTVGVIQG